MVKEAILKALREQKHTRHWLVVNSKVPRSAVYGFLDKKKPRTIPLKHAEAMLKALGLTVVSDLLTSPPRRAGKRRKGT